MEILTQWTICVHYGSSTSSVMGMTCPASGQLQSDYKQDYSRWIGMSFFKTFL